MSRPLTVTSGWDLLESRPLESPVLDGPGVVVIVTTLRSGEVVAMKDAAHDLAGFSTDEVMTRREASEVLGRVLPEEWFDPLELTSRTEEMGVSAPMAVLHADAREHDRLRRERLDLGALDRRGRGSVSRAELPPRPTNVCPREWSVIRGDSSRFTTAFTVHRTTSSRRHIGYLAVLEDVTDRGRMHEFLLTVLEKDRETAEQIQELSEARRRLVENASCEFQTPVASLVGFVELLQEGDAGSLTADQTSFVDAIAGHAGEVSVSSDNRETSLAVRIPCVPPETG